MNSSSDDNNKRQSEETSPREDEANVLEAKTVRCFPAVKRSFRQKQSNWRWRWKYFTRALQPISEQGENTKDDSNKVDDSDTNSTVDSDSENNPESLEIKDQENSESNNQHSVESRHNFQSDTNANEDRGPVLSKEDYSACTKLIEKFQEAVLDSAVRIIQAAFKRFRERRRFLKLKKAATVIQRSVRQWLQLRHSNGLPKLQSAKPECEHDIETQKKTEESNSVDEDSESERSDSPTHDELLKDDDGLPESTSEENEQFENSFESLDAGSLSGSADNLSEADIYMVQSEETSPTSDPDALSLTDSGIDMCSDTIHEVAIIDDCECSKIDNTSTTSSDAAVKN